MVSKFSTKEESFCSSFNKQGRFGCTYLSMKYLASGGNLRVVTIMIEFCSLVACDIIMSTKQIEDVEMLNFGLMLTKALMVWYTTQVMKECMVVRSQH
jgi:hypothetical protein